MRNIRNSLVGQLLKEPLRGLVSRAGYDLVKADHAGRLSRQRLLLEQRIDWLLDVGANQGQYALEMRRLGFAGQIDSFEPGSAAHRILQRRAKASPPWRSHRMALGSSSHDADLFISENSVSSSLLPTEPLHLTAAPDSIVRGLEKVPVRPLDEVVAGVRAENAWLKIDTQGYEAQVLSGARDTLARTRVLQVELSLASLYGGQANYLRLLETLEAARFRPIDLIPGFRDPSNGALLQCDALLVRSSR